MYSLMEEYLKIYMRFGGNIYNSISLFNIVFISKNLTSFTVCPWVICKILEPPFTYLQRNINKLITANFQAKRVFYKKTIRRRMPSSGILRRVALVKTHVSEELIASFIRVTRIGELGKTLAVTSNRHTRPKDNGSSNWLADFCPPCNVGDTFLRDVGSYKSHTASHPRIRHTSNIYLFMCRAELLACGRICYFPI
jgi:hypothetical protein